MTALVRPRSHTVTRTLSILCALASTTTVAIAAEAAPAAKAPPSARAVPRAKCTGREAGCCEEHRAARRAPLGPDCRQEHRGARWPGGMARGEQPDDVG